MSPRAFLTIVQLPACALMHCTCVKSAGRPRSMWLQQVRTSQPEDEGLETSTASDDSGPSPWTVVTSPSHGRRSSQVGP